jgi:PAS domain-containing protein
MALCEECVTPRNDTHLVFESRLVDAGGGPVALRLGLDVTGYKKTEFQLSACRQMLQDLIDFLPDLTFAVNTRRKVIAWNHALEQYLGVKASDMIGKGNYS